MKPLPPTNRRTSRTLATVVLAMVVTASCASSGGQGSEPAETPTVGGAAPSTPPTSDRAPIAIFTATQAERGRSTFRAVCAECHYSSEFRGSRFQFSWRRRTVADFFEQISSTMPEDAPGSLRPEEYLDVVAYVLELNGFPVGEAELPLDLAVLETHSMAAPHVDAAGGR